MAGGEGPGGLAGGEGLLFVGKGERRDEGLSFFFLSSIGKPKWRARIEFVFPSFLTACLDEGAAAPATRDSIEREQGLPDAAAAASEARAEAGRRRATAAAVGGGGRTEADDAGSNASPLLPPPPPKCTSKTMEEEAMAAILVCACDCGGSNRKRSSSVESG